MKSVRVIWRDAHACTETWCDPADIEQDPYIVDSVGWLVPDGKPDHLVLAQSLTAAGLIDHVLAIPLEMVVSTTFIGLVDWHSEHLVPTTTEM